MIDQGNQPFMPSMAPSRFQADCLERQVQIIMNDDQVLDLYPEIVGQPSDRYSAQVHECLRLGE